MNDEERELEAIAAEARQLPALTPSRDLWPGIAARIAGTQPGVVPIVRPARSRALVWLSTPSRTRLAVAATLLVALSSAATWAIATRGAATAGTDGFAALVDDETAAALQLASLDASVTEMDEEIAILQVMMREQRASLDPRTVAVVEASLRVIDKAIAESRAALAADPASAFLAAQFTRAYTSKLTLLRDAATLPTGL